jgi:hypothetical protein
MASLRSTLPSEKKTNGVDAATHLCDTQMMATPGQMVQAMADALRIPAVTVLQYDRQLAEAGLRSKGGRGLSAAKVTPTDVANLLIAILGSPVSGASIRAAPQVCEEIGTLHNNKQATDVEYFADLGLRSLAVLPKRHAFREALASIIEGASLGELVPATVGGRVRGLLEVRVYRPGPWAGIRFVGEVDGRDQRHGLVYTVPSNRNIYEHRMTLGEENLGQERFVENSTFEALGKLIAAADAKQQ